MFGAGAGVPENLEGCIERRYFSSIRYLALVCSDETLSERLRRRPAWRGTRDPKYIDDHQRFNQWFINYNKNETQPPIMLLNTSEKSLEETVNEVESWIRQNKS